MTVRFSYAPQSKEMLKWMFLILFSMNGFRKYVAKKSALSPAEQEVILETARAFPRRSFRAMQGMKNVLHKESRTHTHPLLILSGDGDLPIVMNHSEKWVQNEPNPSFRVVENAGHCANMDNPEKFNRLVLDFVEQA